MSQNLPRADYKNVWNGLASTLTGAKLHVAGSEDEELFTTSAQHTLNDLRATVGIRPQDECLEIGCGVGRVGRALSPLVKHWTGSDVSANMVQHSRDRLKDLKNVSLAEISGYDLKPFADNSFDLVYCTVVFMHLDIFERYNYILEAYRVLRPGGRFFCDNTNLLTDGGWEIFEIHRKAYQPLERPPHINKPSTPQELEAYLVRAKFRDVKTRTRDLWVDAWGTK